MLMAIFMLKNEDCLKLEMLESSAEKRVYQPWQFKDRIIVWTLGIYLKTLTHDFYFKFSPNAPPWFASLCISLCQKTNPICYSTTSFIFANKCKCLADALARTIWKCGLCTVRSSSTAELQCKKKFKNISRNETNWLALNNVLSLYC